MERRDDFPMLTKEYCRYIRTYSELKGLQRAHTLIYCASATVLGVAAELRFEQAGRVRSSMVLLDCSFPRAMELMRYLCENGVGLEQWLEVLGDAGQPYQLLKNPDETSFFPGNAGRNLDFCAICPV